MFTVIYLDTLIVSIVLSGCRGTPQVGNVQISSTGETLRTDSVTDVELKEWHVGTYTTPGEPVSHLLSQEDILGSSCTVVGPRWSIEETFQIALFMSVSTDKTYL